MLVKTSIEPYHSYLEKLEYANSIILPINELRFISGYMFLFVASPANKTIYLTHQNVPEREFWGYQGVVK